MKKVIDFLEHLAKEGGALIDMARLAPGSEFQRTVFARQRARWLRNCTDTLVYAGLTEHLAQVEDTIGRGIDAPGDVARIAGILDSARDLLEQGFVGNIRYLLHAEMFGSLVDQADELLKSGHVMPAAVLGRIVVERWLRDQAQKAGVEAYDTAKAASLNEELKKLQVFSTAKWREIQSLLDVGNAAAHGRESEFSDADVQRMLSFTKATCV